MSDLQETLRVATRPIVTVLFAIAIAFVVIAQIDAPAWFISLAIPIILWWFGERAVKHIKEKNDG